jgi:hypothetical protein
MLHVAPVPKGGKTLQDGQLDYAHGIRHRNLSLDFHHALGLMLVYRFNPALGRERFPDPIDAAIWNRTTLWAGKSADNQIMWLGVYKQIVRLMEKVEVRSKKNGDSN